MARFRKAAALVACAVMASTVTGCADTTYSAKCGDETVKAGVYIAYLQNELSNQLYALSNKGVESKDYFSQQIDGVDLAEYVKNNSVKDVKEYVAVKKQFEAEGLSLTDEDIKELNANINASWDSMGDMYENNGVSKESLKELYREALMRTKLFNAYYDVGGKEAPTDEEIQKYVNDNFIRYKMIAIYKSYETDEDKKKAENEEKLKTRDEYYEKGKDLTFDTFDELIHEYNDASSAAAAADTDSSAADTDSSAVSDDTSSAAETESSAADSSEAESSKTEETTPSAPSAEETKTSEPESIADTESKADTESAAETESKTDTDSASDTDSAAETTEPEEEEDPYEHEVMINLAKYTDEDFETESGKLYKFVRDAEENKVLTFENENAYYIVVKGDVSKRTDYVSENRLNLVQGMKQDEFQTKLDGWVESANITINEKAVKRYTPEVIYDRMNEYSKKNAQAG